MCDMEYDLQFFIDKWSGAFKMWFYHRLSVCRLSNFMQRFIELIKKKKKK